MSGIWNAVFPPGLFTNPLLIHLWIAATVIAVVAGTVGVFVNLRGDAFVAHAVPRGAFAGAAAASLVGANTVLGLGVFAVVMAGAIGMRRQRRANPVDVALILVLALGLGDLFLTLSQAYAPLVFSLLFGQLLGVSATDVWLIGALGVVVLVAVGVVYRPLLLASTAPELAAARGVPIVALNLAFTVLVALAATLTVPVVGALLAFSLMVGPAAAGWYLARTPGRVLGLSVAVAIAVVWIAIVLGYDTNLPIGFLVSALCLAAYVTARAWRWASRKGRSRAGAGAAGSEPLAVG